MNELTLKDCMKYPNAKIIRYAKEMLSKRISDYQNIIELIKRSWFLDIGDCKLILRSIESLTEEEKEHIYLNYCDPFREIEYIEWHIPLTSFIFRYVNNILQFINYLRSINIDIDGFIASGKAVAE